MLLKSRTQDMGFSGSILAGDPKGAQLPAALKEGRKVLVCGTIQLPAMMPSNSVMSVHQRSQGELLHATAHHNPPAHVCLCTARAHDLLWRKLRRITARLKRQKKAPTGNYY